MVHNLNHGVTHDKPLATADKNYGTTITPLVNQIKGFLAANDVRVEYAGKILDENHSLLIESAKQTKLGHKDAAQLILKSVDENLQKIKDSGAVLDLNSNPKNGLKRI